MWGPGFDPFTIKRLYWDKWRHATEVCASNSNGVSLLIS